MRVGVIRALTTSDRRLLNSHGKLLQESFGFRVTSQCIPGQPSGVYNEESLREAVPKVVELALEMAPGVDALSSVAPRTRGSPKCARWWTSP